MTTTTKSPQGDEPSRMPRDVDDAGDTPNAGESAADADPDEGAAISTSRDFDALDGDDDLDDDDSRVTIAVSLPEIVHEPSTGEIAVGLPSGIDPLTAHSSITSAVLRVSELDTSVKYPSEPIAIPTEGDLSRRQRRDGGSSTTPESAAMLTADRLLENTRRKRPEGAWRSFVYTATGTLVNLGDSPKARARKAIDARIDKRFEGGTRFIPVLTRKGGVGKTTVTTLLGMAMADVREDRVVAVDANPDRGTLAERISKQTRATVRDVVNKAASITTFSDFSELVSRDETRLDVLASDTDPLLSEAFDEDDYNVVADLAARYYSIMLTDCGTGIVHSVMRATLQRAHALVIVSGGSVDEARLASETLTWLEANGYGDLVSNAIVALNTATQGTKIVKLDEIESHFRSRVRDIVRIPYDQHLATGSTVTWSALEPFTRESARYLAALVLDGIPNGKDA